MERTIKHLAIQNNWEKLNEQVKTPRTVVCGSFNPFHPLLNTSPEFYYCRIPKRGRGNQFWKSIARNLKLDQQLLLHDESARLNVMNEYGFVLFDFIDELLIESERSVDLEAFIEKKILKNFTDSVVWANQTAGMLIKRTYNQRLISFINKNPSIELAINTLGKVNGTLSFNVYEEGWQVYKKALFAAAAKNEVIVDLDSMSPSPQGVGGNELGFDQWIRETILR
jgi:hypothetical protein